MGFFIGNMKIQFWMNHMFNSRNQMDTNSLSMDIKL